MRHQELPPSTERVLLIPSDNFRLKQKKRVRLVEAVEPLSTAVRECVRRARFTAARPRPAKRPRLKRCLDGGHPAGLIPRVASHSMM